MKTLAGIGHFMLIFTMLFAGFPVIERNDPLVKGVLWDIFKMITFFLAAAYVSHKSDKQ